MKKSFVSVLIAAVIVAGCGTTTESPTDAALFQLSLNRQKWATQGVHDYSFDYDLAAMIFAPPVHIDVQNDLVTKVTDRTSGAVYSNSGAPTVDSLFARVESMIRNPSADMRVTYDAQLGFPAKIENASRIPDTGSTAKVTNFQKVP